MRKLLILILIMFINSLFPLNNNFVQAKSKYARANESINLYKYIENNNINNIICIVEKTYFVEILSELENYYKVNYNNVFGYVKKNDVALISNTPSTPFPYNIKLTTASDCNLRSSPTIKSTTNNIISTVPKGESNITFIGRIFSDEAIDFGGTTWYYVKYKDNYGYIYNKYIKSITPIYENTETSIPYTESNETIINPITHTPSLLIIIILFIPCIIILLILYLPRKFHKKVKVKKIPKTIDKY